MDRARGDETVQSGPTVNEDLREIDRSRRNLNTASWRLRSNGGVVWFQSTHKVALEGMVWNEGFEVLVHRTAWWWLLGEKAKDCGPAWVQPSPVGDGRQIEHIPLFRV